VSEPRWAAWPDDRLLALRLCDLAADLRIEGTPLETSIAQLGTELAERNLGFRPHFWLSNEFYTPDGVPGIALPFYLAHPRLVRLEERQMLEVEGGTPEWCLRILRHEAGHAIDNAFALRARRKRRRLFGSPSVPYPEFYSPRPYSRSYVLHLDAWYAQSHPDEDFAETFAVWLTPDANWRKRYAEWPALRKLEYVDGLMRELAGRPPQVRSRARVDPLERLRKTLAEHYADKRKHYGVDYPTFYDRDLRRLFSDAEEHHNAPPATRFLRSVRRDVRRTVARWTGAYQYTVDQVFEDMVARCRELGLRLRDSPERTAADFVVVLAVHTMNYLHSGRHRVAL
jgi:putative zinc-binding metallo-peptidase